MEADRGRRGGFTNLHWLTTFTCVMTCGAFDTPVIPGSSTTGSGEFKRKLNRLKKYVNTNSLIHGDNSLESGNKY